MLPSRLPQFQLLQVAWDTNDGLVAVLLGLGLYASVVLIREPTLGCAAALGILVAAAPLTKSPGLLLFPIALFGLVMVYGRERLSLGVVLSG